MLLQPYGVDIYAACRKPRETSGNTKFQLGDYQLETNFVVVEDAMGVKVFLLGRNFLQAYQVLVNLTALEVVVRASSKPLRDHAHAQVSNKTLKASVDVAQNVVLQPFERAISRAKFLLIMTNHSCFETFDQLCDASPTQFCNFALLTV